MRDFLRECLQLLYWVFFKPTALLAHLEHIAPGIADEGRTRFWLRESRHNAALRKLLLQSLFFITILPLVVNALVGLLITIFGGRYNWAGSWRSAIVIGLVGLITSLTPPKRSVVNIVRVGVSGVVAGIVVGVIVGVVARGLPGSVIFSILLIGMTLAIGMAGSVAGVQASSCASYGAFLMGDAIAGSLMWDGIVRSLMTNTPFFPARAGDVKGIAVVAVWCAALLVGLSRLPIYLFELPSAILAYRRCIRGNTPEVELLRSPVYFDDLLVLPQPFLSALLLRVAKNDLNSGLWHLGHVESKPFQRWAAQRALRTLLERDKKPFFLILDRLLKEPKEYVRIGSDREEKTRAGDRYFTTRLLLAELMDNWPNENYELGHFPNGLFARRLTFWLRMRGKSSYAALAMEYYDLLECSRWTLGWSDESKLRYFEKAIESLQPGRDLLYGEEIFQSLRLAIASWNCETLQDAANLRNEFTLLFGIDNPLRPQIIAVLCRLRDAAIDAASFLTAEHEITKRDALLKAQGALEEARQLADDVYEPEHFILLEAIKDWSWMFAAEGRRVAAGVEVAELPNPYVAGRPIRPEDGKLFVGRRDEFRAIEEKLQTGVGLIVYGQRRIGKSSILLHLRERLPHDLLPVYLNLQMLMAQTTGGFMHAVAREIVKQLHPQSAIRIPPSGEFAREPYLSFNQVLEEIAAQLAGAQRVLLAFDEFEELEKRVAAGDLDRKIFTYLRGVTQTGSRFSLLFAGLHTLEEMTHDYWNPFFQSVQTVRIAYLSELDSRQLITDPIDQFPLRYDEEAIERIAALTRSHPYLAQSVCHNLVNRLNDPLTRSNRATAADVDAVLERTLESSGYYFDDYVWGWSSADERLALTLLAEAGEEAEFAAVEKHLGREAALDATRSLVARDILVERSEGARLLFRFQIPLSRMWVQRTKSSARILLERGID